MCATLLQHRTTQASMYQPSHSVCVQCELPLWSVCGRLCTSVQCSVRVFLMKQRTSAIRVGVYLRSCWVLFSAWISNGGKSPLLLCSAAGWMCVHGGLTVLMRCARIRAYIWQKEKRKNMVDDFRVYVCVCAWVCASEFAIRQAGKCWNGMVARTPKNSRNMEWPNMAGKNTYTRCECRVYEEDKSFSTKRDGVCYASVYFATNRCLNIKYTPRHFPFLAVNECACFGVQQFFRKRRKYGRVRGRRRQRSHMRIKGVEMMVSRISDFNMADETFESEHAAASDVCTFFNLFIWDLGIFLLVLCGATVSPICPIYKIIIIYANICPGPKFNAVINERKCRPPFMIHVHAISTIRSICVRKSILVKWSMWANVPSILSMPAHDKDAYAHVPVKFRFIIIK